MSQPIPQASPAPTAAAATAKAASAERPWARPGRFAVLALADLAALAAAGTLAYFAWARPLRGQPPEMYLRLAPLAFLFLAGYALAGLYPGAGLGPVETLRRQTLVTGSGFLTLAGISFAAKLPYLYSRVTFTLALALALGLVPAVRAFTLRRASRWRWWPEPVVLIGPAAWAAATSGRLAAGRSLGLRAATTLAPEPRQEALARASDAAARGIKIALVDPATAADRALRDALQARFHHVVAVGETDDLPVEGVQVRNLGGVLGLEYTNNLLLPGNRLAKRALDLALGGFALALAAPVVAVAVAAVKLASRGPAFFVQERVGLDGRTLQVRKIRTMHADAERRLEETLAADPELAREWQERVKLAHDPRLIPGVGPVLRRLSIDELPQLASVVSGAMSLVGPRPFPVYHLARFPEEFRLLRQRVRPGVTGLWQVTVRSGGTLAEQQALDSYYIRNGSLWLDLYVLGRTLGAVVTGRGAV